LHAGTLADLFRLIAPDPDAAKVRVTWALLVYERRHNKRFLGEETSSEESSDMEASDEEEDSSEDLGSEEGSSSSSSRSSSRSSSSSSSGSRGTPSAVSDEESEGGPGEGAGGGGVQGAAGGADAAPAAGARRRILLPFMLSAPEQQEAEARLKTLKMLAPYALRRCIYPYPFSHPAGACSHHYFVFSGPIGKHEKGHTNQNIFACPLLSCVPAC